MNAGDLLVMNWVYEIYVLESKLRRFCMLPKKQHISSFQTKFYFKIEWHAQRRPEKIYFKDIQT